MLSLISMRFLTFVSISVTYPLPRSLRAPFRKACLKSGAGAVPAGGFAIRSRADPGQHCATFPLIAARLIFSAVFGLNLLTAMAGLVPLFPRQCYLLEVKVAERGRSLFRAFA